VSNVLPIVDHLQDIRTSLVEQNVILSAAPGAGKSTALLLDLLKHFNLGDEQRILVLQPRRVIVRSLASFLAAQLDESVGQSVGYRIRGENKTSKATQLEIVTEGVFTRLLQNDPELTGIALVVFDEFHERNIHSDFGLALALEAQMGFREDLRLLVMSATLDMDALKDLMPEAIHKIVEGRQFPIEYIYRPPTSTAGHSQFSFIQRQHGKHLISLIVSLTEEALNCSNADVLIFMPTTQGVLALCEKLKTRFDANSIVILPMFGSLSKSAQQRALEKSPNGITKIVVATNIAESSLTIDGIGIVIDSGLERRLTTDLRTGIEGLETREISKASAIQRAGRAGRLAAGICYRLCSQESHSRREDQAPPQIAQVDISEFLLHALEWGSELVDLPLLTQPSSAQVAAAQSHLRWLEAIDSDFSITRHGKALLQQSTSLRLAHMLLALEQSHPKDFQLAQLAAAFSVFIESNRDFAELDLSLAFDNWRRQLASNELAVIKSRLLKRKLSFDSNAISHFSAESLALCTVYAFPDWVGKHQGKGIYKLANGKQAQFHQSFTGKYPEWVALTALRSGKDGRVFIELFNAIELELLESAMPTKFEKEKSFSWHDDNQRFQLLERHCFGNIVINSIPKSVSAESDFTNEWKQLLNSKGFEWLPVNKGALAYLKRMQIAFEYCKDEALQPFPQCSSEALLAQIDLWLLPFLDKLDRYSQLQKLDWVSLFKGLLNWEQQRWIEEELPTYYVLPTADKAPIDYDSTSAPVISVRMQLLYGLQESPRLAEGQMPVTFELLSPAQRPIQTTADLAAFWQSDSYVQIKKEMKGRYPKHLWPDDPANTLPTKFTKHRKPKS
jgi:ATP-dependent helicase HrpB